MRRITLLVLAVALVGGCGSGDSDVRVVAANQVPPSESSGAPSDLGRRDPAGVPVVEPRSAGLEDRPAPLGPLEVPSIVAVVGDSLTVSATDEITRALEAIGVATIVVDAQESRRMASGSSGLRSGVAAIEDVLDEHEPDLWVVALGTNDVASGTLPDGFVQDLRDTIAAVPATSPLVWVDVWIRDRQEEVAEANGIVRRELARRPARTDVVDWFSWGIVDGVITGDGIHLTETGQSRFAAAITDAVIALAVTDG